MTAKVIQARHRFRGVNVIELKLSDALPEYPPERLRAIYLSALEANAERQERESREKDNAIMDRWIEERKKCQQPN